MRRFEIGPRLGSGATGTVYRAHDTVTGDIVALKILHSHLAVPWQELRLARKITHPNVCRLHDLFEEDGQTLISMEFVDGETLKALMERSGVLTVEHTLTIIRQILDGLEAGHRRRIIHRDLKPSNIMIALDGTVKIMDFGLARTEEESGPDVTLSEIAGTSGYVAPDQAIGHTASLRMDLYSVGVILYEMVCGDRPRRETPTSVPGVPAFAESAILSCLQMDPFRRPASAAALREALSGTPPYRPVPSYTAILVICLLAVLAAWIFMTQMKSEPIPQVKSAAVVPAPAAPEVVQELPTVAILFEGQVGRAFANAVVQGRKFRVVDRSNVDRLLSEMRRDKKQMDLKTGQKIGRVVGAQYFLIVNALPYDVSQEIRINAQLVETETTIVKISEGVGGKPENAEKLATELAERFHL